MYKVTDLDFCSIFVYHLFIILSRYTRLISYLCILRNSNEFNTILLLVND